MGIHRKLLVFGQMKTSTCLSIFATLLFLISCEERTANHVSSGIFIDSLENFYDQIPGLQRAYNVPCALIIGQRKESTDRKTSLNQVLREFAVSV